MCSPPSIQGCTAQNQEEKHDKLQDVIGVEDPALLYLVVSHILHNGNEVRQQEDVESSEVPQEARHE